MIEWPDIAFISITGLLVLLTWAGVIEARTDARGEIKELERWRNL